MDVTSGPVEYTDFGADGKPDYEGKPGLPAELVQAKVVRVLRGDSTLEGPTLAVSQPSVRVFNFEGSRQSDRIDKGARVLLVGTTQTANPGVGPDGGLVLNPAPWGQGVYDVAFDGSVSARGDGLLGGAIDAGKPFDASVFSGGSPSTN